MNKAVQRVITGIVMAVVFVPLVILGSWPFALLAAALAYIGGYELVKAYFDQEKNEKAAWLKYVFPLGVSSIVLIGWLNPAALLPITLLCTLGLAFLMVVLPYQSMNLIFFLAFAMQYVGLGLGALISLRYVDQTGFSLFKQNAGLYLFAFVLVVTFFTDMGAYTIGRHFGKRKFAPNISPNKTKEGAVGGLIIGVMVGLIYYLSVSYLAKTELLPVFKEWSPFAKTLIISLMLALLSMASAIGDLVTSKIKRHFGIKDYGNIFPGHGGVMDRFDSVIFSGMMFYLIYYLMRLIA
ncbi:MAG TPA: CDP-archaeol synthase [Bacilli bacterium]|jgi:phosphatidate cytidylyltransferase|nr:CDP-archaeol synthase [Bacilli bacterium]HON64494.1 CDP-archaeol synthase [Bacilli bacterium]HPD12619.1 CDP-archaeol synthase [Bacilli bacterium]HRS30291.1 CDP-archaeol synthase [Bacilli bacterium]HRU49574.1 CDP-archaeol synthase [Bacilli bacterium]